MGELRGIRPQRACDGQDKVRRYGRPDGAQIEKIKSDAFELLEKVGVEVEDADVLKDLARQKGIRVEGSFVYYAPELVERFITQAREQNSEYMLNREGRAEPLVRPPFLCMRVWDERGDAARPATVEDLREAVKLLDSYGVEGISPVHPQEVPERLRQVMTAKVSYENSRFIGSFMQATTIREAEILSAMGEAAGRKEPHVALQVMHSPLKLDVNSMRLILEMRRSNRTPAGVTVGAGAMPLAGAVSPLLMPGFLAQGLAEALSAYGTGRLLNDKVLGYCSIFPGTFDMRYSGLSMGAPEQVLYWLAVRQVSQAVLARTPGGDFACTGKVYDAQAGAEKMAAILTSALSGATTFTNVGMTPTDEVFHFEGAVIDMEILAYAWRAAKGLGWEEAPTADIVREGRAEQTFMTHPTTMRFREEVWAPEVFTREGLNQWLSDGSPSLAAKAWKVARARIAAHEYRPEPDVQRELDRLMEKAEKEL